MVWLTITYYSIDNLFSVKWSLTGGQKTKDNFKLLALTVVMVGYEKWLRTRGTKYINSDLTSVENVWCFGKLVAEEGWSLTRGGGSTVALFFTSGPTNPLNYNVDSGQYKPFPALIFTLE